MGTMGMAVWSQFMINSLGISSITIVVWMSFKEFVWRGQMYHTFVDTSRLTNFILYRIGSTQWLVREIWPPNSLKRNMFFTSHDHTFHNRWNRWNGANEVLHSLSMLSPRMKCLPCFPFGKYVTTWLGSASKNFFTVLSLYTPDGAFADSVFFGRTSGTKFTSFTVS